MSGRSIPVLCILLFIGSLLTVVPGAHAETSIANVRFEAQVPAPTVDLAASQNGRHVLVVDEDSRFTFIPDVGSDELVWRAPNKGHFATVDPAMGEVEPTPLGVAVTPSGDHWAGAARYGDSFGGQLWTFARWSDEPIWTYDLTDGAQNADQPTSIDAGGPYVSIGTEKGKVYIFRAADEGGTSKTPYRTYTTDDDGNSFNGVNDIAMSRDGSRILIGTGQNGKGSLHLYSIKFFMSSFTRITDAVHTVEISADGTRGAAITGEAGATRLHFLDLDRGRTLWETSIAEDVLSVALSQDGSTLAVGTKGGRVLVFSETGGPFDRDPVQEHRFVDAVHAVSVADDGRAIAAGTAGGKLHFLDRERDAPLWTHDAGRQIVASSLGHDADVLVFASRSTENGKVVYTAATHEIDQIAPPKPRLAPGVTTTIPIEVGNNGNRMARIGLDWGTLPEDWEVRPQEIALAPGEAGTLAAQVRVAKGQAAGTYPLELRLDTGSETIRLSLEAVVPEVTSGVTVERWSLPAAIPGGAPAAYLLRFENTGNTINTATIGYAKLPAGWRAEFVGATEFRLNPGEDRELAFKVWAPAGAQIGREAEFDVVVVWKNGEERVPVTIKLVDVPEYQQLLRLDPDEGGSLPTELEKASEEPPAHVDEKDSPAAGLVAVLALLGASLVALQRRRLSG